MGDDEQNLIQKAQRGDHRAFGQLALRYEGVLFNLALRMVKNREDARDLTQAVFLKAYRGLAGFDTRYRMYSWLYRIMLNEALNFLDAKRPQTPVVETLKAKGPAPDDETIDRETSDIITSALMEIDVDYRKVIVLRHFLQLSYAEMGDVLHVPAKTIKSRLFTARRQLGEVLQRRGVATS